MPTGKAKFNGKEVGFFVDPISENVTSALEALASSRSLSLAFISSVVAEAWNVKGKYLARVKGFSLTREEAMAERRSLLSALRTAENKLRSLSHDYVRILGKGSGRIQCADALSEMISRIVNSERAIRAMPAGKKAGQFNRELAIEIAFRLIPILKANGISISASPSDSNPVLSTAEEVISIVGSEFRLVYTARTWRDIISKAKSADIHLGTTVISAP